MMAEAGGIRSADATGLTPKPEQSPSLVDTTPASPDRRQGAYPAEHAQTLATGPAKGALRA